MYFKANVEFKDKIKENADGERMRDLVKQLIQFLPSDDLKSIVRARFMNLSLHKGKYVNVADVDRLRNEIIGILQNISEASYKQSLDLTELRKENQSLNDTINELEKMVEKLETEQTNNDLVTELQSKIDNLEIQLTNKDADLYDFIANSNEKLDVLQEQYKSINEELANKNEIVQEQKQLIEKYERERIVLAQAIKNLQNNK